MQGRQARGRAIHQIAAEQGNARDRLAQRDEVARAGETQCGAAGETLEVLYAAQILANLFAQHGLRFQFGDGVEAGFDLRPGKLRAHNPGAEQTRAHDGDSLVDGAE